MAPRWFRKAYFSSTSTRILHFHKKNVLFAFFSCLVSLLKPSWGHSGAKLGLSWAVLGPSWGPVGALGALLGPKMGVQLVSFSSLGLSWGFSGPPWAILGPSWGQFGASEGLFFVDVNEDYALSQNCFVCKGFTPASGAILRKCRILVDVDEK